MHGAGIYRQRYGEDPGLQLTHADEVRGLVEEFVAEQEASVPERLAQAGVDDDLRWADYRRLQAYDRLSLLFCMRDLATSEPFTARRVPHRAAGPVDDRGRARTRSWTARRCSSASRAAWSRSRPGRRKPSGMRSPACRSKRHS